MDKIDKIRYGDKDYDIGGSGETYSTEEQVIGKWVDGKPLYRKVVNFGGMQDGTISPGKEVAHNIANISQIINVYGGMSNNNYFFGLPYVAQSDAEHSVGLYATKTNIVTNTLVDYSNYTTCYITIEYTKTTD